MYPTPVAKRIEAATCDTRYIATADWLEAIEFGMAALDAYDVTSRRVFNESHDTGNGSEHQTIIEIAVETWTKLNTGKTQ